MRFKDAFKWTGFKDPLKSTWYNQWCDKSKDKQREELKRAERRVRPLVEFALRIFASFLLLVLLFVVVAWVGKLLR